MNKTAAIQWICGWVLIMLSISSQAQEGELVIKVHHIANQRPLMLRDSSYTNIFGEPYSVSRLKYYLSNFRLGEKDLNQGVHLVDAAAPEPIRLKIPVGSYESLSFLVGVDSMLNCSGAQAGALDPLNGMFWTWNTGYIFFKLEGYSPASSANQHRIELHIGGYRGPNQAQQKIRLSLPQPLVITPNDTAVVILQLDLDQYWQAGSANKISEEAVIMSPGPLAKKAADHLSAMFSVLPNR